MIKNFLLLPAAGCLLAACGAGEGLSLQDTWPQQPRIIQDPPPPAWLDDLQQQYRNMQLQSQFFAKPRYRFRADRRP